MMFKNLCFAVLVSLLFVSQAQAKIGAGVGYQVGSNEAVSIGINRWDIGVSVDYFRFTLDHRLYSRDVPNLYFGLGVQGSEKQHERFGVRGKVGMSSRVEIFELYGELVPQYNFHDRGGFEFDYVMGFRIWI